MQPALDRVAEALAGERRPNGPGQLVWSDRLADQFGLPITTSQWHALERKLQVSLPPLVRRPAGLWDFPCDWRTIGDLAAWIEASSGYGDETPNADWLESQIFVKVRATLVDALNVDPEIVKRSARLVADLGAE